MKEERLPATNENGYYEIRLESIGGLGANLCGKMIGELGLRYMGHNSAGFSSYGSEKSGTPVKAYIRLCSWEKEIHVHSPVIHPHLLAVFHEALLEKGNALEGISRDTIVLVNSEKREEELRGHYALCTDHVYCVPAQQIAMECGARINMIMFGGICRLMGLRDCQKADAVCQDTLGKKYAAALKKNLEGIHRGFYEVQEQMEGTAQKDNDNHGIEKESIDTNEDVRATKSLPGGAIPWIGNSVVNDLSPSRQGYFPLFLPERCIQCARCDATCPDMVFQFQEGTYKGKTMMINKGLDYYHCKGCMRCVTICPVNALVAAKESEYPDKPYFIPNQEMLQRPAYYDACGMDGYITSESFLTEKRVDGGEL